MTLPALLSGKRIAILGSASGLGLALTRAAEAAGAEVHGIDQTRSFDAVAAFYQADLTDPDALRAVAHALPEGLDGAAFLPALPDHGPREMLVQGLLAPRLLAQELAPRLTKGASIVLRSAPMTHHWDERLPETRAAMALRPDAVDAFIPRWGLHLDPARIPKTIGWALNAWAMAHCHRWAVRINTLTPATPDGHLPPAIVAATGHDAAHGTDHAAQAALFLLSDLSQDMTGATLATDGGLTAQRLCRHNGL